MGDSHTPLWVCNWLLTFYLLCFQCGEINLKVFNVKLLADVIYAQTTSSSCPDHSPQVLILPLLDCFGWLLTLTVPVDSAFPEAAISMIVPSHSMRISLSTCLSLLPLAPDLDYPALWSVMWMFTRRTRKQQNDTFCCLCVTWIICPVTQPWQTMKEVTIGHDAHLLPTWLFEFWGPSCELCL